MHYITLRPLNIFAFCAEVLKCSAKKLHSVYLRDSDSSNLGFVPICLCPCFTPQLHLVKYPPCCSQTHSFMLMGWRDRKSCPGFLTLGPVKLLLSAQCNISNITRGLLRFMQQLSRISSTTIYILSTSINSLGFFVSPSLHLFLLTTSSTADWLFQLSSQRKVKRAISCFNRILLCLKSFSQGEKAHQVPASALLSPILPHLPPPCPALEQS